MTDQPVSKNQEPNDRHIVVVGGGQAGGWVCKTLRREGFSGQLTVVADEDCDFYERPPLSKAVLTGEPELPTLFSDTDIHSLDIHWQRPRSARTLDADAHTLTLDDGTVIPYDQLVLATGARARIPVAAWSDVPGVVTLRSWQDAVNLREALGNTPHLAVIGGGWIGLEVAASARKLGVEVSVYEMQDRLCARSVGEEVSAALLDLHRNAGVQVNLGCTDLSLEPTADGQVEIMARGLNTLTTRLALVGTGVSFNLDLARQAGLAIEQGVVVDDQGRTSNPDIFAAGDIAQHPKLNLCLQSWAYAQNQAIVVARALMGQSEHYDEPAWLWSDQYGTNIQMLGVPDTDSRCVRREEADGPVFFYLDTRDRLTQLVAFNQARAIKLGKRWMSSQRTLVAEDLADPAFNLMSLR
ncbi:NAD(P)/FAD-dependent oxidoreductase [Saccharospirillum impatiens]|uniref:NAD(P)/FAD-dependent oxidoreductase n=1 Tax=Saccharospirillum impatiens TaxID=169438 RepID=UPI000415A750|nr:FAD-dependent oxidoreductase [Saccharospirillum impatiens]